MAIDYQELLDDWERDQTNLETRIAHLEREREELNAAIAFAQRKLAESVASCNGSEPSHLTEFADLTYMEGAIRILRRSHKALSTGEIVNKLQEGGKGADGKNTYQTVYRTIKHEYDKEQSRVGKRGSKWYLRSAIRFVPADQGAEPVGADES